MALSYLNEVSTEILAAVQHDSVNLDENGHVPGTPPLCSCDLRGPMGKALGDRAPSSWPDLQGTYIKQGDNGYTADYSSAG